MLGRTPPETWGGQGYSSKVLDSILEERDSSLLVHDLQVHARDLERQGNLQGAAKVWQISLQKSQASSLNPNFSHQAQQALKNLAGNGPLGSQLERGCSQVIGGTIDPWLWLGFGLGTTVYRATRLGFLKSLLKTRSFAPRLQASLYGLGAESATFLSVEKVGHGMTLENKQNPFKSLGREYLGTAMSLGLLKATGFGTRWLFDKFHGIDPLIAPVTGLSGFANLSRDTFHQLGMFTGLMLSHESQIKLGWAPPESWMQKSLGALTSLLQLNLAGAASQAMMGARFRSLHDNLELQAQRLSQTPPWLLPVAHPIGSLSATGLGEWSTLMMKDGNGGSPKGKIIPFPKNPYGQPILPKLRDGAKSHDLIRSRASSVRDQAEEYRQQIQLNFSEALASLELWNRTARQHRKNPDFLEDIRMRFWGHWKLLLRNLDQLGNIRKSLKENLEALGPKDPFLFEHLEDLSHEFLVMFSLKNEILIRQSGVRKALNFRDPQELHTSLDALKESYQEMFKEKFPISFRYSQEINRHHGRFEGLEGMLMGIGLKEIWRGKEQLPPSSPRRHDQQTLSRLYFMLEELGINRANLLERLTEVHSLGAKQKPRVLRYHTDPLNPMMGWSGIFLPAVLARFGGNFSQAWKRLKPFAPHIEPTLWQWTPLALYTLAQAAQNPGEPHSWFKNIPNSLEISAEFHQAFRRFLEANRHSDSHQNELDPSTIPAGDAGAIPWALYTFLKSPYDVYKMLDTAARAPENIREDTMALAGALLGAFHGPRIFSISRLEELSPLPKRRILDWCLEAEESHDFISKLHDHHFNDNVILFPSPKTSSPTSAPSFQKLKEGYRKKITQDLKKFLPFSASFLRRAANTGVPLWEARHFFKVSKVQRQHLQNAHDHIREFSQGENIRPISQDVQDNVPKLSGELSLNLLAMAKDYLDRFDSLLAQSLRSGSRMDLSPGSLDELAKTLRMINILFYLEVPIKITKEVSGAFDRLDFQRLYTASLLGTATQARIEGEDWGLSLQKDWRQQRLILEQFRNLEDKPINWDTFFSTGDPHFFDLPRLLRVHLPIYLKLRQSHSKEIFPDLDEMPLYQATEIFEAWRAVTYLTARLLRGAEPNLDLLLDLKESFRNQPSQYSDNALDLFLRTREKNIGNLTDLIRYWMDSPVLKPNQLVTLGIYNLTLSPTEPHKAVQSSWEIQTHFSGQSAITLSQITSILAEARRQYSSAE